MPLPLPLPSASLKADKRWEWLEVSLASQLPLEEVLVTKKQGSSCNSVLATPVNHVEELLTWWVMGLKSPGWETASSRLYLNVGLVRLPSGSRKARASAVHARLFNSEQGWLITDNLCSKCTMGPTIPHRMKNSGRWEKWSGHRLWLWVLSRMERNHIREFS